MSISISVRFPSMLADVVFDFSFPFLIRGVFLCKNFRMFFFTFQFPNGKIEGLSFGSFKFYCALYTFVVNE